MTLRAGLLRVIRATSALTSTLSRVVEAVAIHLPIPLQVDRLPARLANRGQRIAGALFLLDPLLFVADDVEQQFFILRARQILFTMLLVAAVVQRFAGLAVVLLPCPLYNVAVKADVRRIELLLALLQKSVQALDQPRNFLPIQVAAVIVKVVEVRGLVILQLIVPALDSPDVGPVRRGRMIRTEKVERTRDPLVQLLLPEPPRDHARFNHAAQ